MQQYLDLLKDVLENGYESDDRTGIGTIKVFDRHMRFDLRDGFPLVTIRKTPLRFAFEELIWMLRGQTDANILARKKIHIWDGNTTKEFQEKVGLGYLPEGNIGKGYGHQIRNFNGTLGGNDGIDQLNGVINSIVNDPNGRRHIMLYWNPSQINEAVLPPCHFGVQFMVIGNVLNLKWFQRSCDLPFGIPVNCAFYSLLLMMVSKLTGYEAGEVAVSMTDVHIYKNQIPMVKEMITREPRELPIVKINKEFSTLDGMLELEYSDIELIGYDPHPDIKNKPKMAV